MPGREQVFESKDSGGIYTRWPTHGQVWVGKEKKKKQKNNYYFQFNEVLEQQSKTGFQIKFAMFI